MQSIDNLRCIQDSDGARLTFGWPSGVEHVIVSSSADVVDGRIVTLQEYKRHGGYRLPKEPGIFTFYIHPFGESITCLTGRTVIRGTIKRKRSIGAYATQELTLRADYPVAGGVLCYGKIPCDGVVYSFCEPLGEVPLVWHILTAKHERIKLFFAENVKREIYDLRVREYNGTV
jgi:hypothetical protein